MTFHSTCSQPLVSSRVRRWRESTKKRLYNALSSTLAACLFTELQRVPGSTKLNHEEHSASLGRGVLNTRTPYPRVYNLICVAQQVDDNSSLVTCAFAGRSHVAYLTSCAIPEHRQLSRLRLSVQRARIAGSQGLIASGATAQV